MSGYSDSIKGEGIGNLEREMILRDFEEQDIQEKDISRLVFLGSTGALTFIATGAFVYHNYYEVIQPIIDYCLRR